MKTIKTFKNMIKTLTSMSLGLIEGQLHASLNYVHHCYVQKYRSINECCQFAGACQSHVFSLYSSGVVMWGGADGAVASALERHL